MAGDRSGDRNNACGQSGLKNESWADSQIHQEEFTFRWRLRPYSSISQKLIFASPEFCAGATSRHKWVLQIQPKERGIGDIKYLGVYLRLIAFGDGENSNTRQLDVIYQFIFGENSRNVRESGKVYHEFELGQLGWGVKKLISNDDLSRLGYIHDDQLTITLQMWISNCVTTETSGWGKMPSVNHLTMAVAVNENNEAVADFKSLLTSGLLSDVVIATENSRFNAHKAILACRSPVFARMLQSNMVENVENVVEITEFSDNVIKAMLDYIYSGTSDDVKELAPDLLQVAEKYDLEFLKLECENAISSNLGVENAADAFILAHMHNAKILKKNAMNYINGNKEAVAKSKGFEKLSVELIAELYLGE